MLIGLCLEFSVSHVSEVWGFGVQDPGWGVLVLQGLLFTD